MAKKPGGLHEVLIYVACWQVVEAWHSCDYATTSASPDNPEVSCETLELRNATMSVLLQQHTHETTDKPFGFDLRTVVYRRSPFSIPPNDTQPGRDMTAFRSIVACSVAIGWASDDCGSNMTCISKRLAAAAPFFDRAGERGCDIALLRTTPPFRVFDDPQCAGGSRSVSGASVCS